MTVRDVLRVLAGAAIGGIAAGVSLALADTSGQTAVYLVLIVLAISLVGLSLGSGPAIAAYAVAGVVLAFATVPASGRLITTADVVRLLAFAIGSPIVIALAVRAERRNEAARRAQEASQRAEQRAHAERREAEEARQEVHAALEEVRHERARLQEVAEAIPEPLIVYDDEARGAYGNRAALRAFGRSFFDRPIDDWGRAAEPRDERGKPLRREEWPPLRAAREAFHGRMLVRLPMSGRDLLVDVEGTPIPGGGSVLLLRDVGKEVDERRRLSQFASFVAHELRNPLAVAKARIELAMRQPDGGTRSHSARALESVDAAIGILERLELFSRAESGYLEASSEPIDLRAAVAAAIERLRARGSEREVRVQAVGNPRVIGDRQLTEQAVTNLLTNADRYSEQDEPLDVEIDIADVPLVRVRDRGPGFPDDAPEDLFRERVSSGRGLGLGLYLVNAAMTAQGGSVQLEQRRPQASLVLRWPRTAAVRPDGDQPDPTPIAEEA
ncbi:MAG TPA: PAS domain-containing sensor histidine kinase [Candidatus Limnocylindria bacterium]